MSAEFTGFPGYDVTVGAELTGSRAARANGLTDTWSFSEVLPYYVVSSFLHAVLTN